MSNSTFSWWAQSKSNARWTAFAAASLVTVLALICAFIWWSPSDLASNVTRAARQATGQTTTAQSPMAKQNAQLKAQLAALTTQLQNAQKAKQTLQSAQTALQQSATDTTTKLDSAASARDHATTDLKVAQGVVTELQAQVSAAQASGGTAPADLLDKLSAAVAARDQASAALTAINVQLATANGAVDALTHRFAASKSDLNAQISDLTGKLDAAAAARDKAQTALSQTQAGAASLRDQLQTAQSAQSATKAQLDKTTADAAAGNADLQNQLQTAQSAQAAAKAQLDKSTADAAASEAALHQQLNDKQAQLEQAWHDAANPTPSSPPSSTPTPTPISAPTKAEILNPSGRYWGVYEEQSPFSMSEVNATATKVGYDPTVVGYFQGWDKDFRPDALEDAWKVGKIPLLTWESRPIDDANNVIDAPDYSLHNIISGKFDTYLTNYAKGIASEKLPLIIRLDQEMNGTWYPWSETDNNGNSINGNSPGEFAQMWQHVWKIFQANGANSYVIWNWAPNIVNTIGPHGGLLDESKTAEYYPGDRYVDLVGVDGYLRSPVTKDKATFADTYQTTLDQLRDIAPGKKIFFSEIGATDDGDASGNQDGYKGPWITDLFANLAKPENSDILGFAWFDQAVTSYTQGVKNTNDWRIGSSASALAAFKAGIADKSTDFTLVPLAQ